MDYSDEELEDVYGAVRDEMGSRLDSVLEELFRHVSPVSYTHLRTARYIAIVKRSWVKKVDRVVKTDWLRCVAVFVSMLRRQRPELECCTGQPAAARASHHVYLDQTGGATPQECRLRPAWHDTRLKKSQ